LVFTYLGSLIDTFINIYILKFANDSSSAIGSGVGMAIGALVALWLFKLWFKPDFEGCLKADSFWTGLLMLLPVLVIHYIGSIVSWITLGTGNVFLAFLQAFAPGFCEEIGFRGLGVANYMRTIKSERQIKVIFWLSSIIFGLAHSANIFSGGDFFSCVIQVIYASGIGMLLGAVYLRTGNLLPCILGHMSLDFFEFVRKDLSQSGGLMMGMGAGDWITVFSALVGAVLGLWLIREKYHPEIMEVWDRKWNKGEFNETVYQE
jgi:membrane protease YdiL (CAAX protease family)